MTDLPRRLQPGMVLNEQYGIEQWLGSGGYGDVYRARSLRLDEPWR